MLTDRSYITAPGGRGGGQPERKTGREIVFFFFFSTAPSSCHDHSEYFSQLLQRQPILSLKMGGVKEWKVVFSSNTAAILPQSHNNAVFRALFSLGRDFCKSNQSRRDGRNGAQLRDDGVCFFFWPRSRNKAPLCVSCVGMSCDSLFVFAVPSWGPHAELFIFSLALSTRPSKEPCLRRISARRFSEMC